MEKKYTIMYKLRSSECGAWKVTSALDCNVTLANKDEILWVQYIK